jgi:GTP-binding protein
LPRPALAAARFVGSYPGEVPETGLPEVAFAGRSNVGKSSLLNRLCRNHKLARVSRTPGRTRAVNLFRLGDALCFVDLPGYGYAKAPHAERQAWRGLVEGYLFGREALRLVVHLVDARLPPQASDLQLRQALATGRVPLLVVATKIDGVPRARRAAHCSAIRTALALPPEAPLAVSSESGEGIDALWDAIEAAIAHG